MRPPIAGTSTIARPRWDAAGDTVANDSVWKKNRFVKKLIIRSSSHAMNAQATPTTAAIIEISNTRRLAAKSPRWSSIGGTAWESGVLDMDGEREQASRR